MPPSSEHTKKWLENGLRENISTAFIDMATASGNAATPTTNTTSAAKSSGGQGNTGNKQSEKQT
jgi:glycerate kinase